MSVQAQRLTPKPMVKQFDNTTLAYTQGFTGFYGYYPFNISIGKTNEVSGFTVISEHQPPAQFKLDSRAFFVESLSTIQNSTTHGTFNVVAAVASEAKSVQAVLTVATPNTVSLIPDLIESTVQLSKSENLGAYILYKGSINFNITLLSGASVDIAAQIGSDVVVDELNFLKFQPVIQS